MDLQEDTGQAGESRRESWFVLAFVILVFVIVWLFWNYWGDSGETVVEEQVSAATVAVPDVVGLDEDEAESALESAGFTFESNSVFDTSVDRGTVTDQAPDAGLEAEVGSLVTISVATDFGVGAGEKVGEDPNNPLVPDVVGHLESEARHELESSGFAVAVTRADVEPYRKDAVYEQYPPGGETAPVGSRVTIRVSTGPLVPADAQVPDLMGLDEDEAVRRIEAAGLVAEVLRRPEGTPGKVYDQFPFGGETLAVGSEVNILVGD